MGSIANVVSSERSDSEGTKVVEVRCDTGGGVTVTADHFQAAGVDALPLPGDFVALEPGDGAGNQQATGYHDGKNQGKARPGEFRALGRDGNGKPTVELWMKNDGTLAITGLVNGGTAELSPSDGSWTFNGAKIDAQGNFTSPGEITAKAGTPAAVKLSSHTHPTGTGPSGPPTPGS